MGKDACCDTCERFGHLDPAAIPERDAPVLAVDHRRVQIVVSVRGGERTVIEPTGDLVRVGRVRDNDVVLASGTISKRQMTIAFTGDRVVVQDTKSACGTFIDGRKIGGPTDLREGSVISCGDFELRVERS